MEYQKDRIAKRTGLILIFLLLISAGGYSDTYYAIASSVSTGTLLTSNSYSNDATYDSDNIDMYEDTTEYVTTFSTTTGTINGVEVCYDLYVTGTRNNDVLWLKYHPAGSSETTLETVTTNVNYDDDNAGTHQCFDRSGDLSWTWSDVADTWIEIDADQLQSPDNWDVFVDQLYIKVDYTPEAPNDAPKWFLPSANGTIFNVTETVEHRTYWTDDDALSYAYLEVNSTGVGCDTTANISEMALSTAGAWSNLTWVVPAACEGETVGWKMWANDSSGDWNVTNIQSYEIDVLPAEDSCTYTSGDWEVDCADNCVIDSTTDLGGNDLIITGDGLFSITDTIHNIGQVAKFNVGCQIAIFSGGSLEV